MSIYLRFYPWPPSAPVVIAILSRVFPSARSSVRSSVCLSSVCVCLFGLGWSICLSVGPDVCLSRTTTSPQQPSKDYIIDLKCDGVTRSSMKQISISEGHGQQYFLRVSLWNYHDRSEGQCCGSNSKGISGVGLKFGGVVHNTMKKIALQHGHDLTISIYSTDF